MRSKPSHAIFHAAQLAADLTALLEEINPGNWVVDLAPDRGFVVIHRRPD